MATGKTRRNDQGELEMEMISGNSSDKVETTWESARSVAVRRSGAVQPSAAQIASGAEAITGPKGKAGEFGDDGWTKDRSRRPKRADATPRSGAGAGPGRSPSGPTSPTINQHFHGVDPQIMAQRAAQAQRRAIRGTEARAMHDTAVPVA